MFIYNTNLCYAEETLKTMNLILQSFFCFPHHLSLNGFGLHITRKL